MNAESAYLKIICVLLTHSLLAAD